MKQTLSKWTQLHSSGGGKSRLLHLALMLICMLATAQAGWAADTTVSATQFTTSQSGTTYTVSAKSGYGDLTGITVKTVGANGGAGSNRLKVPNGTLKIDASSGNVIKSVTITWRNESNNYPTADSQWTSDPSGVSTSSQTSTWSGSSSSVTFTNTTTNTFQIVGLSVTYGPNGGGSTKTDLAADDFKWSATSYTATIDGSNTFPTLTNKNSVSVTYESSNTGAATIASNGTITLEGAGTTTISAIFAGDETYNAKTVTYELTVEAATASLPITPKGTTVSLVRSGSSDTQVPKGTIIGNYIEMCSTEDATNSSTKRISSGLALATNKDYLHLKVSANSKVTINAKTNSAGNKMYVGTEANASAANTTTTTSFADYVSTYDTASDVYIKRVGTTLTIASIKVEDNVVTPTVKFNNPTKTVEVGKTVTNAATLTNASGTTINYTSSNTNVAEVDNTGKVTGVAAGTATITATYTENSTDYTDSYTITVQGLEISTQPKGASYTQNATTVTALTVAATRGTAPYSYQWYKNTDGDTSGKEGDKISGATSATLAASNISTAEVGTTYYYCIVTDAAATPASVTSNTAEINVTAAAAITAPALKIQSGDAYLEKIDDTHYTITDKSQQIKVRLYVEKNTYVRYTFDETMPADPTLEESTATVKDNSSNGSRVESSNITFQGKDTYFVKAKAWNADKTQSSEIITYVFSTAGEKPSAPTITADGTTYTTNKSVTIATTAEGGTTYYKVGATAETSASAIAAGTAITGTSQTITAEPTSAESNIVVSVVTVKDGNYSDIVTATYTYDGLRNFKVKAADKTLQVGGRDNVDPYITYLDGTRFEIGDDDDQKLSDYFTFTYTRTEGVDADVLVASDGVINIPSTATPGNTATITITATPTALGQTLFINSDPPQTGTMTVTVKAKESGTKMSFYWDPEFTQPVATDPEAPGAEWDYGEDNTGSGGQNEEKRSVFKNKYENGRMIYVKAEPGYEIWVATKATNNAEDTNVPTPTASINTYSDTNYSTTHGIPLYIKGMSNGQERTLVIGLKAYKAGTTEGVGSAVSARFRIERTAEGQAKRPAAPTFSPTKSEVGTLSTAQTVAAVGATNSYVFSKFGSSTLGLGRFINFLEGTQAGREQVATFSTEVGPRDIKALQITGSEDEYYISEYGSVDDYQYTLAAKLLVTPATYYVNVGETFTAPALTKITTDQEEEPDASDYSSPTLTGYFYNKQKAEANAAPYQGLTFEKPAGTSLLSYSIQNFNGANASINETTGEVTSIGNKSGYAIVTVSYAGGEEYTIDTKKVDKTNTTTSPMTATYRINIVDPNEYLPTITPSTRKFANNIDVTISAPDENHFVKYVVAEGEAEKTKEEIAASGETINKSSRSTINVGADIDENEKVTVYAVASDDAGNLSPVVKETYTKVTPLQKPTLSPDGVTKPYEYTESELAVAAVAYNAGAVIYYTTDGSDPTKDGAKTYDGASKILVEKEDGTTIVKAAAYLNGIYSDVVTGTYVPTDNLAKPWFLVNETKVEGTEMHISTTDVITIDNDRTSSTYYYTLDGTAPTTTEGQAYTEGFKLVKTVTASAIATENGLISPATTVTFIIDDEGETKHSFWEAIEETTPKGTMAANDRKVSEAKHTDTEGTSSYIYVEHLTATFGGFDNNDWNKTSIGEKTQGAAMDGVGKYSIRNTMDVKEETDRDYDPTNMLIGTVHGRTHALPSQGAYVKFEPEKDGELTIWALQQGGLHYSADGDFCSRFIRFRPVFMVDETGKSIAATKAESTACLSKNWSEVEYNNWLPINDGNQNGDKNLYYDNDQNTAIYNMYTTLMTDNSISDGGSIKPLEAPASIYHTLFPKGDASAYNDVHGYVMPSGGNVKYTFPVKAGKTYFFFGFRTKLGIRGFNFVPSTTDLGETVTLPQNADATTIISTNDDQTKNVKLIRNVKKNIWTTFCLPFSVSQTQLENIFGEGTQVMQFVNVKGYTMNVFKHYHHMIVAGTPILVKPTNDDMAEFTFNGVHIQNVTPEEICDGDDTDYKFVGGYTPMTIQNGSYYIGNKDGLWHKLNSTNGSSTLNGSRAYLKLKEGSSARALTLNIASFNGEDDDTTTGIAAIESNGNDLDGVYDNTNKFDGNIYNLQGQLVRKHTKNLNGLAKGVYIINGKKVVIND